VAKRRGAAKAGLPADPVRTGCELGEPRRVPGRNGGTLTPRMPGSNGGVHRGPDLKPRNLIRAVVLKALSDPGYVAPARRSGGKRQSWRHIKQRQAGVRHTARARQSWKALSDPKYAAPARRPGGNRSSWRQVKKQRHAAVHHAAKALQNLMYDAACGISEAYGPAIRALRLMHRVLQR